MAKLKWTGSREKVGTLLITFKQGGPKQRIEMVREEEFRWLADRLKSDAGLEAKAAEFRANLQDLRDKGVSDADLKRHGIDVAEFERMATTRSDFPLTSFKIQADSIFDLPQIERVRTHQLKPHDFAKVEFINPTEVQGWGV
jgi:hypothetical protein